MSKMVKILKPIKVGDKIIPGNSGAWLLSVPNIIKSGDSYIKDGEKEIIILSPSKKIRPNKKNDIVLMPENSLDDAYTLISGENPEETKSHYEVMTNSEVSNPHIVTIGSVKSVIVTTQ